MRNRDFSPDRVSPGTALAWLLLAGSIGITGVLAFCGAGMRRQTEAKQQAGTGAGILTKLRFAASGFFDQPVALRYRQGMPLQVLESERRRGPAKRRGDPLHQPVFQNTDAADAAFVKYSQSFASSGSSASGSCSAKVCKTLMKFRRSEALVAS